MADRRISELSEMPASGVAPSDLFLVIDVDNPDINERSQRFTASGLMDYVYQRLSIEGQDQRFYVDVANSTQRGFFGTIGVNTISGNTISGGTVVNIASGVTLNFSNFQNQNLIEQNTASPTDSGVILWYRPPVSGLLGRTYYRYINPTGVGPSAIEWVEASPFEATTIEIGTQQVISGIFNPLRIPAATNSPSGYGGIRYTDVVGHVLNASGVFTTVPLTTSGYVGAVPSISGVQEGLPLIKQGDTVIYATLSGSSINTDFSSSQVRFARGTQAAPSITFTGDLNTGFYSPGADQVGITVSGFEHFRVARNLVTISGALNINDGVLTTEQDVVINGIEAGRGGGGIATNTRFGDVALDGNTTGSWNTAIGKDALANNQAGSENTAVGYQSAFSIINGGSSSAFGAYALYSASNSNSNTALGYSALYDVVTGDSNTAVGAYSLGNTTSSNNVGVGYEAGLNNVGGSSNTLVGYTAGRDLTTGSNNTIIGRVPASAGVADTIIIAAGTAEKIKVDSSNNVFLAGTIKTISGGTSSIPIYTTSGDPDTGVFFPSANTVGISASGLGQLAIDINRVTISGTLLANTVSGTTYAATLGSITAPTYSFSGDLNTGIYSPAADRVGITVSGLGRVAVDINRTTISGTFYADTISGTTYAATLGTATAPTYSFSGDLNTGLYSPAADRVGISVSGLGRVAVDINRTTVSGTFYADTVSGSVVTAGLGSEGTPSFSFSGDLNTGIFSPGSDVLGFSASGLGIMEVRSSGIFVSGLIYEAPTGVNYYPVVTQLDIGTDDNQIPLNGYLGSMAFQDEDDIAVGTGTFEIINVSGINVIDTISGTRFVATSGTAAAPAFTFSGDLDTGFFNPAPNTAALSVSGLGRVAIDINRTTVSGTLYADTISGTTYAATLGSITAPTYSFSGDLNTGIYSPAADRVGITVSGLGRVAVDINRTTVSGTFYADTVSGNIHSAGLGTAAAPGFSFSGDLNTGIFSPGADVLAISSSGLSIVEVRSSGVYVSGLIYEMSSGTTYYPVVTQYDVGTALNQIPLNTYLGSMAYQDENDIVVGNGTFDSITVSGVQVFNTISGSTFVATSGTAAVPSFTFSGDLDTGMFTSGANQIGLSVSGLNRVAVDINRTTVSGVFYADTISGTTYAATLGSITAPTYSFSGDLNTGIYSPAADQVGITVSGLGRVAVDINRTTVSGTFYADTISGTTYSATLGSITAPTYSFSGDLNTGIYSPAADRVGITVSGLGRLAVDINRTTVSGVFYADTISGTTYSATLGSITAPTYSFSGDLNTGIYSPAADRVGITVSGLGRVAVDINRTTVSGTFYADTISGTTYAATLGSITAPTYSFSGDLNTGIYSPAADRVGITVSGLGRLAVDINRTTVSGVFYADTVSGSVVTAGLGTASAPGFSFSGDLNTGIFSPSADTMAFSSSGLNIMEVRSSGIFISGLIYEAPTGVNYYPVVTQLDIGTDDNQVPLNGYLGSMAFQDEDDIAVGTGTFEFISVSGINVIDTISGTRFVATSGTAAAPSFTFSGDLDTGLYSPSANQIGVTISGIDRVRFDTVGNVKIGGTADRATTPGTNQLVLFDGTAPVGTLVNGVSLYSTAGEGRIMDSAGNATLLSPHDEENYWVYDSTDTRTNRRLLVHMEKLAKFIDAQFGTNFVEEIGGPPAPK